MSVNMVVGSGSNGTASFQNKSDNHISQTRCNDHISQTRRNGSADNSTTIGVLILFESMEKAAMGLTGRLLDLQHPHSQVK